MEGRKLYEIFKAGISRMRNRKPPTSKEVKKAAYELTSVRPGVR